MLTSRRVENALAFAAVKHAGQVRKGTDTPYITHPVSVALLVYAHGGDEDQVVAALLHDTVEDCGGLPVLEEIRSCFGERVATIVDALTDTYQPDKEPWQPRKQRYLSRLAAACEESRLVAACDKLHNARSVLTDYITHGEELWQRFRGGKEGSLWYYRAVADEFGGESSLPVAAELERVVRELETRARRA